MALIRGLDDLDGCRGGAVAIGNFDGVHRGHQAMIAELRRFSNAAGAPAVAVTFEPPPVELLRPEAAPPRLMTLERKAECLRTAGADCVVALPTTDELLALTAREFFGDVLVRRLGVRGVVEGPNFRFGKDRRGDVRLLRELCKQAEVACTIVGPVQAGEEMVSSSLVRARVLSGDLRSAAGMLGRPHEAIGSVVRGAARGRELGFPTANVAGVTTLLPPDGVYAGRAEVGGRLYPAAVHLGPNSTFGESDRSFEAHLLDFEGDLYGSALRVELIERVRGTTRFEGRDALVRQIEDDCRRVRELVATPRAGG